MGRRNRSTGKGSFVCEQRESENGLDGTALESKLSGSVADDGHVRAPMIHVDGVLPRFVNRQFRPSLMPYLVF